MTEPRIDVPTEEIVRALRAHLADIFHYAEKAVRFTAGCVQRPPKRPERLHPVAVDWICVL